MAAEKFCERMHHDVGAVLDRSAEIGRRQRVVDNQRHACALGESRDRGDIGDDAAGIGNRFDEDRLGLGRNRALEARDVVGIGPHHVPAEILERVVELVDRAAIELLRGDEFLARPHQAVHDDHLRGVAGGNRKPGGAAFEGCDALFQHRIGRVADARIDVAKSLQAEQGRRVVDAFEHERGGLVDRGRARAGGGIGLRAGVDGQRRKPGSALGHGRSSLKGPALRSCRSFIGPGFRVKSPGLAAVNGRRPWRRVGRPRSRRPPWWCG